MATVNSNLIGKKFKSFLCLWNRPLWALITAFVLYLGIALAKSIESTQYNYFAYLADAFLHGQFHLRLIPPATQDLVLIDNKLFLYWLPMPSILMIPLVAIFGTSVSDVLLTVIVGAINVSIVVVLLQKSREKEIHQLSPLKSAILVIFFAFGTVHFTLTPYGKVWQLSQEICLTFMLLTYLSAIVLNGWKAFLFTGISLTGAILTRSNVILVGIWPIFYLGHTHWQQGIKNIIKMLSLSAAPILMGFLFIFIYNFKRFGDPLEMGLQFHNMASLFANEYETHGYFSLYYLRTNLYYNFFYYPFPITSLEWMMGGSLFLLSPVYFSIFYSFHDKSRKVNTLVLWVTILVVSVPMMVLMGTGLVTFGPRYTLDFAVPLILLTAIGLERWSWKTLFVLTVISSIHYSIGTLLLRVA